MKLPAFLRKVIATLESIYGQSDDLTKCIKECSNGSTMTKFSFLNCVVHKMNALLAKELNASQKKVIDDLRKQMIEEEEKKRLKKERLEKKKKPEQPAAPPHEI